jgi:hypothetical protein
MDEEYEKYRIDTTKLDNNDNDKIDIVLYRLENRNKIITDFLNEKKEINKNFRTKRRWKFSGIPDSYVFFSSSKYTETEVLFFLSNARTEEKENELMINFKNKKRDKLYEANIGTLRKNTNKLKNNNIQLTQEEHENYLMSKEIFDDIMNYKKELLNLSNNLTDDENNEIAKLRKDAFESYQDELKNNETIMKQSLSLRRPHNTPKPPFYPYSKDKESTSGGKKRKTKSRKSSPKRKRRTYKK